MIWVDFQNSSTFHKPWKLEKEIPTYLSYRLADQGPGQRIPSPKGMHGTREQRNDMLSELCTKHMADWAGTGVIENYGIHKSGMSSSGLASFNSYTGAFAGELLLFRCSDGKVVTRHVDWKIRDNELGVRAPYVYIPVVKDKYSNVHYSLEKAFYGDSVFEASVGGVINDSLAGAYSAMKRGLEAIPVSSSAPPFPERSGNVVHVDGATLYVNLGSASGVSVGDSAVVSRDGIAILDVNGTDTLGFEESAIATGRIQAVKSEKLSIISVKNSRHSVAKGDRVRVWK